MNELVITVASLSLSVMILVLIYCRYTYATCPWTKFGSKHVLLYVYPATGSESCTIVQHFYTTLQY